MTAQLRLVAPPRVKDFCPGKHCRLACAALTCLCKPCWCETCKRRGRRARGVRLSRPAAVRVTWQPRLTSNLAT